jgi:GntR family transcriptional regulator
VIESNGGKVDAVRARIIGLLTMASEGDRVPSERELAVTWGVARMTLRRALDELVAEGMISRVPGRGTFVARPRMARHLSISSFTEQMRQQGRVPGSRVVEFRRTRAGARQARQLRLPVGDPIVRFTRLRLADGEPIGLETTCVSTALVPGLKEADLDGSWYELLATAYGIRIARGTSMLEPALITERQARPLETASGRPAFRIETTTFAVNGAVIDVEVDVYRGDRYTLTADIRPEAAPPAPRRSAARRALH